MTKYFNMIRYRVGLPGVDANDMAEADNFEKIIRNFLYNTFALIHSFFAMAEKQNAFIGFNPPTIFGTVVKFFK